MIFLPMGELADETLLTASDPCLQFFTYLRRRALLNFIPNQQSVVYTTRKTTEMAPQLPKIFIDVPVSALEPSIAFYKAIGFTPNPKFSDPTCMMMVLSPTIYVMLITPERFADFMPAGRTISDAKKTSEVLLALSADSKEAVDDKVAKAAEAGGKADVAAKQDTDDNLMYSRSFEDLDGHVFHVVWMGNAAETVPETLQEQEK